MPAEIELIKLRASANEENYKNIDDEMFEELSKEANGQVKKNL